LFGPVLLSVFHEVAGAVVAEERDHLRRIIERDLLLVVLTLDPAQEQQTGVDRAQVAMLTLRECGEDPARCADQVLLPPWGV